MELKPTSAGDDASLREFAVEVVQTLRDSGYQALWAGGCVRDQLRGVPAKDYDVATSATPDQIQSAFGRRRTIAVGKQFGVIVVRSPKRDHQIEVATFRRDMEYKDGRRPTAVEFTSAEEDALRRDFTINGLFFDPLENRIIDYVDGQRDLQNKVVRAIGNPADRFAEDKLRILRAIRFATILQFTLHADTSHAISDLASQLIIVSSERIACELRAILTNEHRASGLQMLCGHGLLEIILPELTPLAGNEEAWNTLLKTVEAIQGSDVTFEIALAIAFLGVEQRPAEAVMRLDAAAKRLKLANREIQLVRWLIEHYALLADAPHQSWATIQPLIIHDHLPAMLRMLGAQAVHRPEHAAAIEFCQRKLALPADELNPVPLLTGDDLVAMNVPPGAIYASVLSRVRSAQLLGDIKDRPAAIGLATSIVAASQIAGDDG